jgi:hypothetical protein
MFELLWRWRRTTIKHIRIKWIDHGREPQCAPDPEYPDGKDMDMSEGASGCTLELPYPAKRCGLFCVSCKRCGTHVVITTAGRPDDPRRIKIRCKLNA